MRAVLGHGLDGCRIPDDHKVSCGANDGGMRQVWKNSPRERVVLGL